MPFRQIAGEHQVDVPRAAATPSTDAGSSRDPRDVSSASSTRPKQPNFDGNQGIESLSEGTLGSASQVVGLPSWDRGVEVVTEDGSASGHRKFIVWNPPLIENIIERRMQQAEADRQDAEEVFGLGLASKQDRLKSKTSQSASLAGGAQGIGRKRNRKQQKKQQAIEAGDDDDEDIPQYSKRKGRKRQAFSMGQTRAAIAHSRRAEVLSNAERMLASSSGMTPEASAVDFVMGLMKGGADAQNTKELSAAAGVAESDCSPRASSDATTDILIGRTAIEPEKVTPAADSITTQAPARKKHRISGGSGTRGMYHGSKADRLRPTASTKQPHTVTVASDVAIYPSSSRLTTKQDSLEGPLMTVPESWFDKWKERREDHHPARKSSIVEGARLLADLVKGGMKTLLFVRVRKVAELLLQYTHEFLGTEHAHLIPKVKSYRGGYMKQARRTIERALFSGKLLGVVATNALELGVDIGALDAVVLLGYPGSAASMWQQAGRAGRGGRDSVAILVTWDAPVDQFFVKNPGKMFAKPPEAAHIDVQNPSVLRSHAICAAFEAPLTPFDLRLFGAALGPVMTKLRRQQVLIGVGAAQMGSSSSSSAEPESGLPWVSGLLGGGAGLGSLEFGAAMAPPSQMLSAFEPAQAEAPSAPSADSAKASSGQESNAAQWRASGEVAAASTMGGGGGFLPSSAASPRTSSSSFVTISGASAL